MAEAPLSLQDIIRRRQRADFVGRDGEIAQFRENLDLPVSDERRRVIFDIHGDAGVGKSFLVRHLRREAAARGSVTAYADETAHSVPRVLETIAADFAAQGKRLKKLEERLAVYSERIREMEADPDAPQETAEFLTRTAVTIGLHTARSIPVAGVAAELVDAQALADQANRLRVYLGRKFRGHGDVRLLLTPAAELTPLFVSELSGQTGPVALFFDTYERTSAFLDTWLLDLLSGRYGTLPGNLVITVSGQLPLDPNRWSAYLSIIRDTPLAPFTEIEARQLLSGKGVTDERVIEVILALSGRLPLLVAMLAQSRPDDPAAVGDPNGDAVERFLKWEDDPVRRSLAVAAALPRRFDEDVLGLLTEDAQALYSWLRGMPFVSSRAGACHYHDVVRAVMLRQQRTRSPQSWHAIHENLANGYAEWRGRLTLPADERWSHDQWHHYTTEQAYHALCADPPGALARALEQAVHACGAGIEFARRWAEMIAQAGADSEDGGLRAWGGRLRDSVPPDESDPTRFLNALIDGADLPPKAKAAAYGQRGWQAVVRSGDERPALDDFDRALRLDPDNTWALAHRGEIHRVSRRFEAALADLDRAVELDPSYAWAIGSRGQTYLSLRRYNHALADFDRAVELKPDYAWAIANRGQTHRSLGHHDAAIADLTRAIELNPDYAWAIANRGETYRLTRRYDDAVADLTRAIDLKPDYAWALASRGETYRLMRRHDDAVADFSRAIDLKPGYGWAMANRGQTYRALNRYDEALADFDRAAELDPGYAWVIANRGETLRLVRRYEEALADFDRALARTPDHAWVVVSRAHVLRALGRHREALTDLRRAVQLDPANDDYRRLRDETAGEAEPNTEGGAP